MRVMLVSNIEVEHGHANGATGRLVRWDPDQLFGAQRLRTVCANIPDLQVRFYHEAACPGSKPCFLPFEDFMDICSRKEVVPKANGQPFMVYLPLQTAYCLTINKIMALTIRHGVNGLV